MSVMYMTPLRTLCALLDDPSLAWILVLWFLTVWSEISKMRAICLLENPSAVSLRTSISLQESA